MAKWRKILTSGSAIDVTTIHNESAVDATFLTGSFTGSFTGDGSGLTGVAANTFKTIAVSGQSDVVADDANDTLTLAEGSGIGITTNASTDTVTIAGDDASTSAKGVASFSSTNFDVSSGAVSVKAGGIPSASLVTEGVDENHLATSVAGAGLAGGNGTALSVGVDDSTIEINSDELRLKDSGITNAKIATGTIASASISGNTIDEKHLKTSVAGAGLAGGNGTALSVGVDNSSIEINSDSLRVKALGITNAMLGGSIANNKLANDSVTIGTTEVDLGASSTTLDGMTGIDFAAGDAAIGASIGSNNLTLGGGSSTVVIDGNLTVNGSTTTVSSTNVTVGDQLLFLATGSEGASTNKDAGIIALSGSVELQGSALYHDKDSERWSVAKSVAHNASAVTPLEHVVTVKALGDNDAAVEGDKEYGVGEMAVNSDGTIWIYS